MQNRDDQDRTKPDYIQQNMQQAKRKKRDKKHTK